MAQSDQTVQNATFPAVRADINDNLAALFSQSSGPSAPAVTAAYQPWIDISSSPAVWKVRDSTNSGWITVGTIDATTFAVGGVTAIANGGTGQTSASGAINALLPAQAGQSGKALTTDGTAASWDTLRTIVNSPGFATVGSSSIDVTSIPNWVKRITIQFFEVSTNGTSPFMIRLGDSAGFYLTDYKSSGSNTAESGTSVAGSTSGLILMNSTSAGLQYTGNVVLTKDSFYVWTSTGTLSRSDNLSHSVSAGYSILFATTLTQLRLTTNGGVNLFNNGNISLLYEG